VKRRRSLCLRPALCFGAFAAVGVGSCAAEPPVSSGLRFAAAVAAVLFASEMMRVFERLLRLRRRRRR
jgi:hypothetical protein